MRNTHAWYTRGAIIFICSAVNKTKILVAVAVEAMWDMGNTMNARLNRSLLWAGTHKIIPKKTLLPLIKLRRGASDMTSVALAMECMVVEATMEK